MDWARLKVAACRTHHVVEAVPAYAVRFSEVLKFHAPGVAPAMDRTGAFHIRPDGVAAYADRFVRTFGFYEGLAAVDTGAGWTHVDPAGQPAYAERYVWCGNFQGGRVPVRTDDGYLHLDRTGGRRTGPWAYCGDFRGGVGVVQRLDGLHTHIDSEGLDVHGRLFQDLDVFHKGFARARDLGGWHHITLVGEPAYSRRFSAVEPFYNGQARVTTLEGDLEVVDERGVTVRALP
jgi:hypothetical protein